MQVPAIFTCALAMLWEVGNIFTLRACVSLSLCVGVSVGKKTTNQKLL